MFLFIFQISKEEHSILSSCGLVSSKMAAGRSHICKNVYVHTIQPLNKCPSIKCTHTSFLAEQRVFEASAGAAGGEEEPVHEDAVAVVVGVVGQQAVPLVLLLALAIASAANRARRP